ncbi:MAG: hypothetical protein K8I82_00585, partial [Anaerolineae bacterium]|nr:hypothetical protein [Anaerolineae bacterium]
MARRVDFATGRAQSKILAMSVYKNFELQIHQLGENLYLAKVTDSPTFEQSESVSARFQLPFKRHEIKRFVEMLSGERPVKRAVGQKIARDFGEGLFRAIFTEEVGKT